MSIHSSAFSITRLTKKDSAKFRRQVTYGRPAKAASQSLKEGKALLKSLEEHGYVTVKVKKARIQCLFEEISG